MSDAVKNVEIEDVLSSIRRLVTEDNRIVPSKVRLAGAQSADRLVLTPALRVPEPEEFPEPANRAGQVETLSLDAYRTDVPVGDGDTPDELVSDPEQDIADDAPLAADEPDEDWADIADEDTPAEPEPETAIEFRAHARPAFDRSSRDDPADAELPEDPIETDEDSADSAPEINESQPWKNGDSFLFQAAQLARRTDAAKRDRLQDAAKDADGAAPVQPQPTLTDPQEPETEAEFLDAAPDLSEDAGMDRPLAEPVDDDQAETEAQDYLSAEPEQPDTDLRTASLSAKIEALEAAIAETQDQWEPDGQGRDDYAGTKVDSIDWQQPSPDEGSGDDAPEGADSGAENEAPAELATEILVETPAAKEDPVAEEAPAADLVEDVPVPEDAIPEDAVEEDTEIVLTEPTATGLPPEPDMPEEVDAEDLSDLAAHTPLLDEESLREMVAEIVREELQGALGERITRNVRKLVRREIQRALTAQQLE